MTQLVKVINAGYLDRWMAAAESRKPLVPGHHYFKDLQDFLETHCASLRTGIKES